MPLQLLLQLAADHPADRLLRLEATDLFQQSRRQRRQFELLDFQHLEFDGHVRAAQVLQRRLVGDADGRRHGRAGTGLFDEGIELGELGVGEGEPGPDDDLHLAGLGEEPVAGAAADVGHDQVTDDRRTVMRNEPTPLAQQVHDRLVDVGGGDLPGRTADREPLPGGQVELGADLDRELERHRTVVGHEDGVDIQFRFTDRRQLLLLGHLRERVGEELGADLVGEFRLEPAADEPARGAAGAKSGKEGGRHEVAECLILVARDVLRRDCHLHAPLASGHLVDGDVEPQRLRSLGFRQGDGGCFARHGRFRRRLQGLCELTGSGRVRLVRTGSAPADLPEPDRGKPGPGPLAACERRRNAAREPGGERDRIGVIRSG
jgi:hypothetical protein